MTEESLQLGRTESYVPPETRCTILTLSDTATAALGFNHPLTEMNTRSINIMFLRSRVRQVRKADNFTAICEPIVWTLWYPQHLTTLYGSTACYGGNFTSSLLSTPLLYIWLTRLLYPIVFCIAVQLLVITCHFSAVIALFVLASHCPSNMNLCITIPKYIVRKCRTPASFNVSKIALFYSDTAVGSMDRPHDQFHNQHIQDTRQTRRNSIHVYNFQKGD
jgi:hypothetical protein